jgi:hypothetical protein
MTDTTTLDDSLDDGDLLVIARLRRALDAAAGAHPVTIELDAPDNTPDNTPGTASRPPLTAVGSNRTVALTSSSSAGLRPSNGSRRPRSVAWLGVAAACTTLVGGASWALSQRQPAETATAPDPGVAAPVATEAVPPASVLPAIDPAVAPTDEPWYTLASANLVPGRVTRPGTVADSGGDLVFQTWRVEDDQQSGFIFASVSADRSADTPGDRPARELTSVTDGRAWLLDAGDGQPVDVSYEVFWARSDGGLWVFGSQGLSEDLVEALVSSAEAGSGLPIVLPAGSAGSVSSSVVAVGTASTRVTAQAYTGVDGGSVDLTITDGAAAPTALIGAQTVEAINIAATSGWLGRYADGHVEVVWDAGGGWWGLLGISPELADNASGIVAAVMVSDGSSLPARPAAPPVDAEYRVIATVTEDTRGLAAIVPEDTHLQTRVGISGFSWDAVEDERIVDGVTHGGPYDMVVRWDGYSFDLVDVLSVVATPDAEDATGVTGVTAPTCPTDVPELDRLLSEQLPELDTLALGIISYGFDLTDGDCSRLQLHAYLDTPELEQALAPYADRLTIDFVLTPMAA